MARRVLRIRSVLLSRVFSATQHGVRDPYGVMVELDFLKKIFLLLQIVKIGQAQGSLNIYEISVINFFSIWSIMKNLLIAVCLEKSWEILVPETCAKMFLANQIAGFLYQLHL